MNGAEDRPGAVEPEAGQEPGEGQSAGRSEPAKMPEWGIDDRHREPYFDCPKMKRIPCCSVNSCPLDPKYPRLTVEPEDPEQKCRLSRAKRKKLAAEHPGTLKFNGLTVKEWNWRRAWERLPAKEKERRKTVLLEARGRLHSQNGGKNDKLSAGRVEVPQSAGTEDPEGQNATRDIERQRARFEAALSASRSKRGFRA